MKMTLICMKMKLRAELIFIWKVSHLDSFWNRGTRELGNGLYCKHLLASISLGRLELQHLLWLYTPILERRGLLQLLQVAMLAWVLLGASGSADSWPAVLPIWSRFLILFLRCRPSKWTATWRGLRMPFPGSLDWCRLPHQVALTDVFVAQCRPSCRSGASTEH